MSKKITNNAGQEYERHLSRTNHRLKGTPATDSEVSIFMLLQRKLTELAMNRFKWVNLPDSVDVRFLEKTLFYNGLSVFYKNRKYDKYLSLPASFSQLDYQENPISYRVMGGTRVNHSIQANHCVPIWANYMRSPDTDIVDIYASRLARLDRTVDVNLSNARQPRILVAPQEAQLSVENISKQIDEGQPTIRVRSDIGEQVKILEMGVDAMLFEKVSLARTRIWNECMGLLGIKHANQDKKERLVSDEVAANDEQISVMKSAAVNTRKIAADQINRMFNLNVQVDYDEDVTEQLASTMYEQFIEESDTLEQGNSNE